MKPVYPNLAEDAASKAVSSGFESPGGHQFLLVNCPSVEYHKFDVTSLS